MTPIQVTITGGPTAWINGDHLTAVWQQGPPGSEQTKLTLVGMSKADALDVDESPGNIKDQIVNYGGGG